MRNKNTIRKEEPEVKNVKNMYTTAVITVILVVWLLAVTYLTLVPGATASDGTWRCSAVNCTKTITGVEWAQQNCFIAANQTLCKIIDQNNQNQLIPLEYLNLSAISQCVGFQCVEEIKVRSANYAMQIPTA